MVNLVRVRGDTYPVPRVVKSTETKAVADITGWSIVVVVSTEPFPADSADQVFTVNATLTTPASGRYQWAPEASHADNVGRMFFGVVATKPDTSIETLETGLYTVNEGVK